MKTATCFELDMLETSDGFVAMLTYNGKVSTGDAKPNKGLAALDAVIYFADCWPNERLPIAAICRTINEYLR